jgi:hypothetical protein
MSNRASRVSCVLVAIACLAIGPRLHAQCANTTTLGVSSTCFGTGSLESSTTGAIFDVAIGFNTLNLDTSGSSNTAVGAWVLALNTGGNENTGVGHVALANLTTGNQNTAVGSWALSQSATGDGNTALGWDAMGATVTGGYNTATGYDALADDGAGGYNVAMGDQALWRNTSGFDNTAVGADALANQLTGNANLALGIGAGAAYTGSESFNVLLDNSGVVGESYVMRLGAVGLQTKTFVAGIYGATSSSGVPVYVNSSGQLGTATSSLRFKEDVADLGAASDELLRLRPVTFHYKAAYDDGQRVLQYGLIAEEVAAVDPGLVEFGADGQPLTVRYHFVDAMLLGEVQKQHANLAGQEALLARQAAEIAAQKTAIAALTDRLAKLEAAVAAARPPAER